MKKLFLLAAGVFVSFAAFSQFSFGLQGTGSLADAKVKTVEDLDYRKKMKSMPGAGVVLQYQINKNVAIRSGVNYVQNGIKLNTTLDQASDMKVELENTLHYVQVPLNVLLTKSLGRLTFFAGAGGYINYGVSGTSKATLSYTMPNGHVNVEKEKADAFKKEEDGGANLKQTDYGVSGLAGIQLPSRVFINAGYQFGLANVSRGEGEYKNRSLQLTVGYFF